MTQDENNVNGQDPEVDFTLRLVSDDGGATGALVMECATVAEAKRFLERFVEYMYPPGERGSTLLAVSSKTPGHFMYEARSSGGAAKISLTGVDSTIAGFMRESLLKRGALLIVFAGREGGEMTLVNPQESHLVRTYATIDGEIVHGNGPTNFSPLLAMMVEEFPVA